jgi:hypothetical protein
MEHCLANPDQLGRRLPLLDLSNQMVIDAGMDVEEVL